MAIILGTSGAWKQIVNKLKERNLIVSAPHEIQLKLIEVKNNYDNLVNSEIQQLKAKFNSQEEEILTRITDKSKLTENNITELDLEICNLQSQNGIFRKIFNWFKINKLKEEKESIIQEEKLFRTKNKQLIEDKRQQSQNMQSRCVSYWNQTILRLEEVLSSELKGAKAELAVINCLEQLPSNYYVLNNLNLRATRYIHFNNKPLQTAQIDHLVIGQTGIFLIEVKAWSKKFIESGNFFDPYEQVARASYLCWDLLHHKFDKIRVNEIIVYTDYPPPAPMKRRKYHPKIVHFQGLINYIIGFKSSLLKRDTTFKIKDYLSQYLD